MARLEELERKFEENPRRYFAPLANEYRKAGDAKRAAELCRAQLPEVPGHISGHIVLGQALYDARDFDGSRAALENALALDPENIVALRYLGDIARDTGDAVEAERWYSRTLEADPYNETATTALQALREAPAVERSTDETPQPTDEVPQPKDESPRPADEIAVESPELLPPADSPAAGFEPTSYAPEPAPEPEPGPEPEPSEPAESLSGASTAASTETPEAAPPEPSSEAALETRAEPTGTSPEDAVEPESRPIEEPVESSEFAGDLAVSAAPESTEPFDVAAPAPPEPATIEEALETEERVLESAAPFVTETMADLYMEQGYPHEALELLLQLVEQRPQDEQLRGKIEHIESVIVARRDAAVAAARAERAETAEALAAIAAPADAAEAVESAELVAEAHPSVREMFARMDRARPRAAGAVTARPISRRRSDFVPMPDAGESEASADPFAFPNAPEPGPVPRTSGPQQTFNPSTADNEDFDAWLRGLKGP